MIIGELAHDDVLIVLEHVQATCACREYCGGCRFYIPEDGCALAHLPERWQLDHIGKGGDLDD